MAIALTERPFRYSFSRNEARYVFNVSNPLSEGCCIEIRLYCHGITNESSPAELVTELRIYPSPDGFARFYVQDYLHNLLQLQLPASGSVDPMQPTKQQLFYWIEFRQITSTSPNNAWVIEEREKKRIMLLGGIEIQKFERNNFFVNFLIPQKKWLTWLPSNRFVYIKQEHFLTWLRYSDVELTPQLVIRIMYTDGTEEFITREIENYSKSFLYHIPAGVEALGFDTLYTDKTIYFYELSIDDPAEGLLVNPYRFYINYDHLYKFNDWVYFNSLGGLDAVRVSGERFKDVDREVSSATRLNVMKDLNDAVKEGDTIDTGVLLTKKWKGDIGYLNTSEEQDSLGDLLASPGIYEAFDQRWLKVSLQNKTQSFGGSNDTKWSFPIEWVYGYVNEVYTPDLKLLGDGTNDEEYSGFISSCPAPTTLMAGETSTSAGISTVIFSWVHGGNMAATVEVKKDGETEWSIVLPTGGVSGLLQDFPSDGSTYKWRLKVKCYNEDESSYVNGNDFTVSTSASYCEIPSGLSFLKGPAGGGNIPFILSWSHSSVSDFKVQYKKTTDSVWNEVTVTEAALEINVPDDGSTYQWRVKTICGVDSESVYVDGPAFVASSAVTCTNPYSLTRTVITADESTTTIRFAWNHPGAVKYLLEWTTGTGETEVVEIYDDKFKELTFSNTQLVVNWKVAAYCSPSNPSAFVSGPRIFLFS